MVLSRVTKKKKLMEGENWRLKRGQGLGMFHKKQGISQESREQKMQGVMILKKNYGPHKVMSLMA